MKGYLLAFLTLAAAATFATAATPSSLSSYKETVVVNGRTITKAAYLEFLIKKFQEVTTRKRGASDNCKAKSCADEGEYCNDENYTCSGFTGCINEVCGYTDIGDDCTGPDTCHGPSLYCDIDRCREYAVPGTICTNQNDCNSRVYDLYCNVLTTDVRPLGFCKLKEGAAKKVGEECDYASQVLGYENCTDDSAYCTATEIDRTGVCKKRPSKVGEACETDKGCNTLVNLYCSEATETCQELPKVGQKCTPSGKCYPGHYCDTSDFFCYVRKDLNETCSGTIHESNCMEDLECVVSILHGGKRVCGYSEALPYGYCDSYISCPQFYACINDTCINEGYQCYSDDDCKYK